MVGFASKRNHIESALQAGFEITLLVNKDKFKSEYEDIFDNVLVVSDVYDWQEVKALLDNSEKIDAVFTRHENYISVVGAINEYLNLGGIDYLGSRNFCNKYLMKKKWLENQVPCADGICLSDLSNLDQFLAKHSFPLILKKTSAVHSNFVIKVKSKADLMEKLDFFKNNVDGYVTSKPMKGFVEELKECSFLLEEMLHGRELTVDTFVSQGKFTHTPICEYVMAHELDVDDSYLPIRSMPTDLSDEQKKIVYQTVEKALSALSAKKCVCHTELFFNDQTNSCVLIESTPRGGGNRSEMTMDTTGFDYSLAVFKAVADLEIGEVQIPTKAVSVVEYFTDKNGILSEVNLDLLNQNKFVSRVTKVSEIGQEVEQAKFGGKAIVTFFVEGRNYRESRNRAIELFKQVKNTVKVNYS